MYEAFYGLNEKPFSLLPDPAYLYLSRGHRMALTMLEYGLTNQSPITVVTGEIGAGKTTLVRQLLNQLEEDVRVGLITNTHKSFGDLLQWVAMAFELEYKGKEKVELYEDFVNFLIEEYAGNRRTVLIVDEAQNLEPETLEELRMLSNVNADKAQVLQLVLVGQPDLRETLARPDLVQFQQRVASNYHLSTLSRDETREYVAHRIRVAGGNPGLFEQLAVDMVWHHSRGVPRLVNTLCDLALVYGYAEQREQIGPDLVASVADDRKMG